MSDKQRTISFALLLLGLYLLPFAVLILTHDVFKIDLDGDKLGIPSFVSRDLLLIVASATFVFSLGGILFAVTNFKNAGVLQSFPQFIISIAGAILLTFMQAYWRDNLFPINYGDTVAIVLFIMSSASLLMIIALPIYDMLVPQVGQRLAGGWTWKFMMGDVWRALKLTGIVIGVSMIPWVFTKAYSIPTAGGVVGSIMKLVDNIPVVEIVKAVIVLTVVACVIYLTRKNRGWLIAGGIVVLFYLFSSKLALLLAKSFVFEVILPLVPAFLIFLFAHSRQYRMQVKKFVFVFIVVQVSLCSMILSYLVVPKLLGLTMVIHPLINGTILTVFTIFAPSTALCNIEPGMVTVAETIQQAAEVYE